MKIRALKLKDARFDNFHTEVEGRWDYERFVDGAEPSWQHDWISFDCLLADDARQTIWCGLTSFATDIFFAYDLRTGAFRDLEYRAVGDRYDAKFHRSLLFDADGAVWAATALLHDIDRYWDAPGGALVRFDPDSGKIAIVARPMPHLYIQSIAMDTRRRIIYGQTFTPERLFRFDVDSGSVTDLGPTGSGFAMCQSECLAVDPDGTCWGTWGLTRAWLNQPGDDAIRLWRYHPDEGRIAFLRHGLPRLHGRPGNAAGQGFHIGPDGQVYAGTAEGLLCRIDPATAQVTPLGKPGPARRLAAMANGPDGNLYGTAGNDGACVVFRYEPERQRLTELGPIHDPDLGERAWHIHCITITTRGVMYAGENDVPYRSGYLWEIGGVCGG